MEAERQELTGGALQERTTPSQPAGVVLICR